MGWTGGHSQRRATLGRGRRCWPQPGAALRLDPSYLSRFSDARRIIAFRNRLIHSYDSLVDDIVWCILKTNLPVLRREVAALLARLEVMFEASHASHNYSLFTIHYSLLFIPQRHHGVDFRCAPRRQIAREKSQREEKQSHREEG